MQQVGHFSVQLVVWCQNNLGQMHELTMQVLLCLSALCVLKAFLSTDHAFILSADIVDSSFPSDYFA